MSILGAKKMPRVVLIVSSALQFSLFIEPRLTSGAKSCPDPTNPPGRSRTPGSPSKAGLTSHVDMGVPIKREGRKNNLCWVIFWQFAKVSNIRGRVKTPPLPSGMTPPFPPCQVWSQSVPPQYSFTQETHFCGPGPWLTAGRFFLSPLS